jgi:hypothetical protein
LAEAVASDEKYRTLFQESTRSTHDNTREVASLKQDIIEEIYILQAVGILFKMAEEEAEEAVAKEDALRCIKKLFTL